MSVRWDEYSGEWFEEDMCFPYKSPEGNPFVVGDIVKLKTGTSPQIVRRVEGNVVYIVYMSATKYPAKSHHYSRLELIEPADPLKYNEEKEEEINMSEQLFMVKSTKKFCTIIGKNSQGQHIVELKGDPTPIAVNRDDIEEVLPFTFEVLENGGQVYYTIDEQPENMEVGDVVLVKNATTLGIVSAVDTKTRNHKVFHGSIIKPIFTSMKGK